MLEELAWWGTCDIGVHLEEKEIYKKKFSFIVFLHM